MIRLTKKDIKFLSELKITYENSNTSVGNYVIKTSFKDKSYNVFSSENVNHNVLINLNRSPTGNCQMFSYVYINQSALMLDSYYSHDKNIKDLKKRLKVEKSEINISVFKNSIKQYEISKNIARKKYFATLACLDFYNRVVCSKKLFFADVNSYNLKSVEIFLKYFTKSKPKIPFTNYISTNKSSMNIGLFELDQDKLLNYNPEACKAKIKQ